jgi:hypothetical protein
MMNKQYNDAEDGEQIADPGSPDAVLACVFDPHVKAVSTLKSKF